MLKLTYTLLLALVLGIVEIHAQSLMRSTMGMAGSSNEVSVKGRSYFVSQSIGQVGMTGTSIKNGRAIRQGFQQPPMGVSIRRVKVGELAAAVYPNPTQKWVNVIISENSEENVTVLLYDNLGRIRIEEHFESTELIEIDFSGLSNGAYVLQVIMGNKQMTTTLLKQ